MASIVEPVRPASSNLTRARKTKSLSHKAQILCLSMMAVWSISPPLLLNTYARLGCIISAVGWLLIELIFNPQSFARPSVASVLAFVYICYSNLISFYVDGPSDAIRNLQVTISLFFIIISEAYRHEIKALRPVFWLVYTTLPLWLITTLFALATRRNVARLIIRSTQETQDLQAQGVGGYALVYFALLCIPISWFLFRERAGKARIQNVMLGVVLVLSGMVVVLGGYSIAVLLLGLCGLVCLMVDRLSAKQLIRVAFTVIAIAPVAYFLAPAAGDFAIDLTHGTSYEHKVRDIFASFGQERELNSVKGRTDRYGRSIDLFKDNPMTGVLSARNVGKHSAVLDRYAKYGVIGGSVFLYAICFLPFRYMKQRASRVSGLALATAIVAIPFAFLNNLYASFGIGLFILFPVAADLIREHEWNRNNELQAQADSERSRFGDEF